MTAPRIRAGDPERQQAVDRLARHFTEGRLDGGEYDDRVRRAYAVVYLDEIPALFTDLPAEPVRTPRPDQEYQAAWERGYYQSGWGTPAGAPGGPYGQRLRGPRYRGHGLRRAHQVPMIGFFLALVLLVSVGIATHGFFVFPFLWIAVLGLGVGRRGRRRGGPIQRR